METQPSRSPETAHHEDRKPYEAPQLTVHGRVKDITGGEGRM